MVDVVGPTFSKPADDDGSNLRQFEYRKVINEKCVVEYYYRTYLCPRRNNPADVKYLVKFFSPLGSSCGDVAPHPQPHATRRDVKLETLGKC